MKKAKPKNLEDIQQCLLVESNKLRTIGYLIESQADTGCVPLDIEEIHAGLGMLLIECSGRIRDIAKKI